MKNTRNLETCYPELAREWHPTLNGELKPSQFSYGSGKRVWWKCEKGHEWETVILTRTRGSGCPACARQKRTLNKNSLSFLHPELAEEFHPTKNGNLTTTEVTVHDNAKLWWFAECGHEWEATIYDRIHDSTCPECAKIASLPKNNLLVVNPELAEEWHPTLNGDLKPEHFTYGTVKQVWWQGACGHEWQAGILYRIRGSKCPICRQERLEESRKRKAPISKLKKKRSNGVSFPEKAIHFYLKELIPDLQENLRPRWLKGKELDIYSESLKLAIEYDGQFWHQDVNRDIYKSELCKEHGIDLLRIREPGCPDLPEDFLCYNLWDLDRDSLTEAIQYLVKYLEYKYQIKATTIDIDVKRDELLILQAMQLSELENSFARLRPEPAKEWHTMKNGELKPEQFACNSSQKVWWLCKEGHEWLAAITNRSCGYGCPICARLNRIE